jgi:hypothetical protein
MSKLPVIPATKEAESTDDRPERTFTAIGRSVMATLGRPDEFLRITIRQITAYGYRVNVLAGADATSTRIAHSYFVTADEDGAISRSTPAIVKLY